MENIITDIPRINYPKVRRFIDQYNLREEIHFGRLKTCCYQPGDNSYYTHTKTFDFKHPIDDVWKAYKAIHPRDVWSGDMVKFGVQYSRKNKRLTYPDDDEYDGIEEGQIIILNLRLFNGMLNLAVGHEIMEVNEEEKFIRICYLENAASKGSQFIQLSELPNNRTRVEHKTFYKSNSWFRDRILYPGLHEKAISEFHGNVMRKLNSA